MRGSNALIRTHQKNEYIFNMVLKAYIVFVVIVAGIVFFKQQSLLLCLSLFIPDIICLFFLRKRSYPQFTEIAGVKKLISVTNIDNEGINAFLFDVLFCSMLGHALICFSWKLGFIYFGVVFSFVNEFLYKPYKQIKGILNKKKD